MPLAAPQAGGSGPIGRNGRRGPLRPMASLLPSPHGPLAPPQPLRARRCQSPRSAGAHAAPASRTPAIQRPELLLCHRVRRSTRGPGLRGQRRIDVGCRMDAWTHGRRNKRVRPRQAATGAATGQAERTLGERAKRRDPRYGVEGPQQEGHCVQVTGRYAAGRATLCFAAVNDRLCNKTVAACVWRLRAVVKLVPNHAPPHRRAPVCAPRSLRTR